MKPLPLGGRLIRFPKRVESKLFVRYARKPDNFNTAKNVLGCHIDMTASLYAVYGGQVVAVTDQHLDDDNIFRTNKVNSFTKLPVERPLLDINGTKTGSACVPGNMKAQLRIANHIFKLTEYVQKEMSPERIREIAEAD